MLVKVLAQVKTDNSGLLIEVPVLLSEYGVFDPLLDYVISQSHIKSLPWMNRITFACQLLLEYMEANTGLFSDASKLFQSFVMRLSLGSISPKGNDPSGLYWLPRSTANVNQLLSALNGLTDWLANNRNTTSLNPFEQASSHQERLNYAAWYKRNQYNFLGHIKSNPLPSVLKTVRKVRGKKDVLKVDGDAISFPEKLFKLFFIEGLGKARDKRVALRDQLIVLLMHGTGVRESDALHLWVDDVFYDPENPSGVIVRLYHPEDGRAPNNWTGRKRQKTRAAYLSENYNLIPRNRMTGTARVGWKTKVVDDDENYIQLHWFPAFYGELFAKLWQQYLLYLLPLPRMHPYAFVSFSQTHEGQSLTLNAFNQSYKAAMARINLVVSKPEGRTPHAHRHAYGRRMSSAGIDPRLIKKALHHASFLSQAVYTQPSIRDVTLACERASKNLDGQHYAEFKEDVSVSWQNVTESGFEDIDPDGLFSGKYPKLRRYKP